MMALDGQFTRCVAVLVLVLPMAIHNADVAGAADTFIDACLAANVNTEEPDQIGRVIGLCTSALAEVDDNESVRASLLEVRGVALRHRGDLELSLLDLNRAVELDSGNAGYLRMRGWTLREIGRPVDAENDYDRALALDPEWQGYLSRCVTRIDRSNYAGALEDCDTSLRLRRLGDGLFFSALALHRLGRSAEALPRVLEACELDEALPDHFILLALVQAELGRISDARETAKKALRQFPNDAKLRNALLYLGL